MTSQQGSSLHPSLGTLALYSSGDLGWTVRWRVGRHVNHCADCEHQVNVFRAAKVELRREAKSETLTSFEAIADWAQLEREMLGNIAVGLAAARCVDKGKRGHALVWRGAFAAGMAALFVVGWMTHIPNAETKSIWAALTRAVGAQPAPPAGTILQTTRDGITVHTENATLTIMHPPTAVLSMSGTSAVAARYVDEETGQVTITKVYGQ